MANQVLNQGQTQAKMTVIKTDTGEISLSSNIVKNYLVNGNGAVTDQEVKLFIALCSAQKLNPFIKEAYLIKYGSNQPAAMVVSKDVLQKRAEKHPQYNGKKAGIIVLSSTGEILHREGGFYLRESEKIVGGWCEVYRKDREIAERVEVNLDEYIGTKTDGSPNGQWAKRPATMIRKVAVAQALRETFTQDLQGMYSAEEFGEDETVLNKETVAINEASTIPQFSKDQAIEDVNPFQQAVQQEQIQDDFSMPGME